MGCLPQTGDMHTSVHSPQSASVLKSTFRSALLQNFKATMQTHDLTRGLHPVMAGALAPFLRPVLRPVPALNTLGIDVRTRDAKELVARLKALSTTVSARMGGQYREDPAYCQVLVTTSLTEQQLDDWLYAGVGIDYVGVFNCKEAA